MWKRKEDLIEAVMPIKGEDGVCLCVCLESSGDPAAGRSRLVAVRRVDEGVRSGFSNQE